MATAQNLKDALTFIAPVEGLNHPICGVARIVGNAELQRFQDALAGSYTFVDALGDPRVPDANDAAAWLWKQAASFTKQYERKVSEAAVAEPSELSTV